MGLFRGPLAVVALSMLAIGLGSYLLRRTRPHLRREPPPRRRHDRHPARRARGPRPLLSHPRLQRTSPSPSTRRSKPHPEPNDLILLDGELTSGSTLIFYTGQQVHLINGRVNGLWYGSFWPDAPHIFETEASLRQLWASPRRIFLFTYNPEARTATSLPSARSTPRRRRRQNRPHQSLAFYQPRCLFSEDMRLPIHRTPPAPRSAPSAGAVPALLNLVNEIPMRPDVSLPPNVTIPSIRKAVPLV